MWTCPPCGTTNESHRIFCSACGAMKSKSLVGESHAPAAVEPFPVEPASDRELTPSPGRFAMQWIGMNVAAAVLGWMASTGLHRGVLSSVYQRSGETAFRVMSLGLSAAVYGILYGVFQAWALSRAVSGGRWSGWAVAKIVGVALGNCVYLAFPFRSSALEEFRIWAVAAALAGLVGGGTAGILQALTLSRRLGPPSWFGGWTLLSAGASALASLMGATLSHTIRPQALASSGLYFLISFGQAATITAIYAILTGIPLGRWLHRHPGVTRETHTI